jgi:hypothetical protein
MFIRGLKVLGLGILLGGRRIVRGSRVRIGRVFLGRGRSGG